MQKYCPLWNCLRSKTSFPKFTAGNKIWKGFRSTFFPEPTMKLIRMCICENCKMYLSNLRNVFVWIEVKKIPQSVMKLIRMCICRNCTMYLSGLNIFPRACYEIDTLACILFGLSPDQIYQVSFLQYLAISCNKLTKYTKCLAIMKRIPHSFLFLCRCRTTWQNCQLSNNLQTLN